MASVIPLTLTLRYYVAECPKCGQGYVWIQRHLDAINARCKCGFQSEASDWPIDDYGTITIVLTDDGVEVIEG